jgi:hypothetical protein
MKKFILGVFLIASAQLNAQSFTERVIFSTGGSYGQPGNQIQLHSYNPQSGILDTIASFAGDFSNDVAVLSTQAFVHVGRASGHPLGGDAIYRVDILTGEVLDSTQSDVAGLQDMEFFSNQYLVYNRGFGASSDFLVAKNFLDLNQTVYPDVNLPVSASGLVKQRGLGINPDHAYVSYTKNDSGFIAVYDVGANTGGIMGLWYNRTLSLDTLAAGIGDMVINENTLYAANQRYINWVPAYNGFSIIDLTDDSSLTDTSIAAGATLVQATNQGVLGVFNGGLGLLNPVNMQVSSWSPEVPSAMKSDTNGTGFFAQTTNYFSEGHLLEIDQAGVISQAIPTAISGSGLGLAYNRSPAVQEELQINLVNNPDSVLLDAFETDWLDSVKVTPFVSPSSQAFVSYSFASGYLSYQIPVALGTVDTVVVEVCDRFQRCDTTQVLVYSAMGEEELREGDFSVYPNPATNQIRFSKNLEKCVLQSVTGEVVLENYNTNQMNLSTLPNGVYFLKGGVNGIALTRKIVKK